jgi:uncharacterized protein with WD repeat
VFDVQSDFKLLSGFPEGLMNYSVLARGGRIIIVNAENTDNMSMSRYQNTGQNIIQGRPINLPEMWRVDIF